MNSQRSKNSNIRSRKVFWTIERYLCANFQVNWSSGQWGVAFWRSFFQFSGQNTIFSPFLAQKVRLSGLGQINLTTLSTLTVSLPWIWKNDLQNATPPSLHDHFTWKFAKRCFSRIQKFDENRFLNFWFRYICNFGKFCIWTLLGAYFLLFFGPFKP